MIRAVLDACVLAPMPLADTLLRLADPPSLYLPLWSQQILAELDRTLTLKLSVPADRAARRIDAMRAAFPEAMVSGFEHQMATLVNHPKDRHVLAAAIGSRASHLVTLNLRDFPREVDELAIVSPDEFLLTLLKSRSEDVLAAIQTQSRVTGFTPAQLLTRLRTNAPEFARILSAEL